MDSYRKPKAKPKSNPRTFTNPQEAPAKPKGVDTVKNIFKAIGGTFIVTLIICYVFFALVDVAVYDNKCYFMFGNAKLTYKENCKVDKNGNVINKLNVMK